MPNMQISYVTTNYLYLSRFK